MSDATIFARATPPGRSAVAIVRISGPDAGQALRALGGALPPARRATLRTLADPGSGEALDRAIVLWVPGPATQTGEDCAELHLHGGRAVIAGVLDALARLPGLRPAEPGEFARRGFLAGKLDLAAAEGLAALIDADTAAQRRQALRQAEGHLGRAVEAWRGRLIELRALAEAAIDFADEEDVGDPSATLRPALDALAAEIGSALAGAAAGERLREGATVVVAGRPNAGKSSLLNRLAGRDVAIVTAIPGTTRDLIEVQLDLGGLPVTLVDTAGLRETDDVVEREGVARALRRAGSADLVLWVTDARVPDAPEPGALSAETPVWMVANKIDLVAGGLRSPALEGGPPSRAFGAPGTTPSRAPAAAAVASAALAPDTRPSHPPVSSAGARSEGKGIQHGLTERDTPRSSGSDDEHASAISTAPMPNDRDAAIQVHGPEREAGLRRFARDGDGRADDGRGVERSLAVSCTTGAGLAELVAALGERLADMLAGGETALVAEARQRRALEEAAAALAAAEGEQAPELIAENLRRATDALGRITGRIDVEEVLDAVFARFCIGK